MHHGVGLAEQTVEHVSRHVWQGQRKQKQRVFASQRHLKGALAAGGVIHLAHAESHQSLTDHAPVGQTFLCQQDAGNGRCRRNEGEFWGRLGYRTRLGDWGTFHGKRAQLSG